VLVATFAGGEWAPPQRIAAPDGYPEYPRIAVALGNRLQVAYFVRDKQFEIGHYVLYTVAGESDARAIAPVVLPPAPPIAPAAPTVAIPAVHLNPVPTIPVAPAPLPPGNNRLWAPQAEVNEPAQRALWVTLLALGVIVALVGLLRWLWAAQA
jgi:hypothetical protein